MMKQILDSIQKEIHNATNTDISKLLETTTIAVFGSESNAKAVISKLKADHTNEQDFIKAIENKLHLDSFQELHSFLINISSLTKMIFLDKEMTNGNFHSLDKIPIKDLDFLKIVTSNFNTIVNDSFNVPQSNPLFKMLFTKDIANKIKFTRKEIYEEFKVNTRTFSKWLKAVGIYEKYKLKRKLNLLEYIDIHVALFYAVEKSEFNMELNREVYHQRVKSGLVFTKHN